MRNPFKRENRITMADGTKVPESEVGWMVTDPEGRIIQWGPPMEIHLPLSALLTALSEDKE